MTTAGNEALDRLRREGRTTSLDAAAAADDDGEAQVFTVVDPERGPDLQPEDAELVQLVWTAASALSPKEYALLDMHVRQELGAEEIADEIGLSIGVGGGGCLGASGTPRTPRVP